MSFTEEVDPAGRYGIAVVAEEPVDIAPTVFFEGGLAAPVEMWSGVMAHLAGRVDTVATERPNTFRSARVKGRRDVLTLADELLQSIHHRAPDREVILVAEGFGGLVVIEAAFRDTKGIISGLVLVNSLHPETLQLSARQRQAMAKLEAIMVKRAIASRLPRSRREPFFSQVPVEESKRAAEALESAPWTHRGALRELRGWKRGAATSTGAMPAGLGICVISSANFAHGEAFQVQVHKALCDLSATSTSEIVKDDSPLLTDAGMATVAIQIMTMVETSSRRDTSSSIDPALRGRGTNTAVAYEESSHDEDEKKMGAS